MKTIKLWLSENKEKITEWISAILIVSFIAAWYLIASAALVTQLP